MIMVINLVFAALLAEPRMMTLFMTREFYRSYPGPREHFSR